MSKGSNTQQQSGSTLQNATTTPDPAAYQRYLALLQRATDVSNIPFAPYQGPEVAPINEQQLAGVGNINNAVTAGQPYFSAAGTNISGAGTPVSASDISQYTNPWTENVVSTTLADFDAMNKRANSITTGNAAASNALGGNRVGVAQALTQEGQSRTQAPIIAGLRSSGYQDAEHMANAQKNRQLSSGQAMGTLGTSLTAADINAANAQFAVGTAEQQTTQQQYTQAMTDYYTQQGYPYATAQWLAAITLGAGPALGSTSAGYGTNQGYTQGPQPNQFLQAAGLGIAGLGALGTAGGSAGIMGLAPIARSIFSARGGRIKGFADGGTPYGPGTTGWVPTVGTMPRPSPQAAPLNLSMNMSNKMLSQDDGSTSRGLAKGLGDAIRSARFGNLINSPTTPYDWGSNPTGGLDLAPEGSYAYADGGGVSGDDLLSSMPSDLGPQNLPPIHPGSKYGSGESSVYFPGNPNDPHSARWLTEPEGVGGGRMVIRRPGTRAAGGNAVSAGFGSGLVGDLPEEDFSDEPPIRYTPSTAADRAADDTAEQLISSDAVDPGVPSVITASYKRPADTGASASRLPVSGVASGADSSDTLAGGDMGDRLEPPKRRGLFDLSPEGYQGLISMGLGMMANRRGGKGSFLAGVGEAGEQGLQTFASARNATIAQEALRRKEAFERQKQTEIETHNRALEQHNTALERNQQRQIDKPPVGYKLNSDGTLTFIPKGPADPETVKALSEAKSVALSGPASTEESLDASAHNYRMTGKLPPNMGRGIQGAAEAKAIKNRAAEQEIAAGGDPNDWSSRWQVFSTRAAGLRSFEQRAAGLTLAENEARTLLPRVREASAKVNRTQYPTLNSLILAAKKGSGGEDVIKLGIAIESLIPVYARVLKPVGQIGVTDTQRAGHLLDIAWSDGQIGAALDQMEIELHSAKTALGNARKEYNESGVEKKKKETDGSGAPKVGDEKQFKQGIGVWDGTQYVPKGQP